MELIFKNWKARCSSLGHILTCLPSPFTSDDTKLLSDMLKEKETGINANGNKTRGWTDTKENDLQAMLRKKEGKDELPPGCITHLEDIFRSQFWGRKRFLYNKYLEKGTIVEEDNLELLSKVDGVPYWKNDQQFENDYIMGCPDNVQGKVRDMKSNFDMDTFDKAEMTTLYEWQVKGYMWLTGIEEGELCYGLVNTPYHLIEKEKNSLFYAMGRPDDLDPKKIEAECQLERNMIFDMAAFKKEYPNADLMHGRTFETSNGLRTIQWQAEVPAAFRVKRFPVTLEEKDIDNIKRRVTMCREWLVAKEIETRKKLDALD